MYGSSHTYEGLVDRQDVRGSHARPGSGSPLRGAPLPEAGMRASARPGAELLRREMIWGSHIGILMKGLQAVYREF